MSAVAIIGTRQATQWSRGIDLLHLAAATAQHPEITRHLASADAQLQQRGVPTRTWAERIAAIAVIAARRADTAPTPQRRVVYRQTSASALDLLELAERVHGVEPSGVARAELALLSEVASKA